MATTRELNNTGYPFIYPDGSVISGAHVYFTLVNYSSGVPISAWTETGSRVASVIDVVTDAAGEFAIDLACNDTLSPATKYLCTVQETGDAFFGMIVEGVGSMTWLEFFENTDVLTPLELSLLQTHIADTVAHVNALDHTFLTNARINNAIGATGPTGPTGATGPQGPAGSSGTNGTDGKTILNGVVGPTAGDGTNGDFWLDTATDILYGPKAAGTWPAGVSLIGPTGAQGSTGPTGIAGTNGLTVLTGSIAPTGGIGVDGDSYIDTVTSTLYSPKAVGAWPAGVALIGATGATGVTGATGATGPRGYSILNGIVAPSAGDGIDGDFWLDTVTSTIYGPKSAGAWGAGTLLIGPTGAQGIQGIQGITGPTGPAGATGIATGTAGSVVFIGAGGTGAEDNSYFYYDLSTHRMHIGGNSAPPSKLTITGTTANDSAALGAEFLTDTGWTSTGWTGSWATGWTHTAGNTSVLSYPTAASNATKYQIGYIITGRTLGSIAVAFGGQSTSGITATGAFGPTTTSTANLTVTPTSDFNGTVVLSIKPISAVITPQVTIKSAAGSVVFESVSCANNLGIGTGALAYVTTGTSNSAMGYQALRLLSSGIYNTASGYQCLYSSTTGSYNSGVGYQCLYSNVSGSNNVAIGMFASRTLASGSYNVSIGESALYSTVSASSNVAIGASSLYYTTGGANTAIGYTCLMNNAGGAGNTALGSSAGRYIADGVTVNTAPNNSVYLGAGTKSLTTSDSNQVIVGYSATGMGSNTTVIGNANTLRTRLEGVMNHGGFGGTTTDATPAEIFVGSTASQRLTLNNNSAFAFSCFVTAAVTGGGDTSGWKIEGVIKRGANAASTALVGTATPVLIAQDAGASTWAVAVTADTTNGSLKITVTGQAATTIKWSATCNISEVKF